MVSIGDILTVGRSSGIFDFYLPFILSFAIFYGLLEKSKVFGDSSKDKKVRNINIAIALAASFMIIGLTPISALVHFLGTLFTQTLIALVGLLSFIFIFYLLLPQSKEGDKAWMEKYAKYIVVVAAVIAIGIFIASGGFGLIPGLPSITIPSPGSQGFSIDAQTALVIILVVATIVLIWYLTREGGSKEKKRKIVSYKPVPVYEDE